ncbi:MAG: glucose-1-phosphate adenylyltransferase subunit GlgD [Bacillus sp. (in: firmicutes)]
MNALGIIFTNIRDKNVSEITKERIMASVPFAGRYRLIDFVLSNMTNSGIIKAGVVTRHNQQNLLDHLGTGKAWDLARNRGGIRVLQPYCEEFQAFHMKDNRVKTLKGIMGYLDKADEDYIVMSDCDIICNISYADILRKHCNSDADITVVYQRNEEDAEWQGKRTVLEFDEQGRIIHTKRTSSTKKGDALYLSTMVVRKDFLKRHIERAFNKGYKSLLKYWIDHTAEFSIRGYEFKEYYAYIDSLESYLNSNLAVLDPNVREALFRKKYCPIYTNVNDSPATMYGKDAVVENSIVADGCVIEGIVTNSVIFRGVKIEKNAVVSNSVVMQDSVIGRNAMLNHIVMDKDVAIGDHRTLCGHETHPFFIEKGSVI